MDGLTLDHTVEFVNPGGGTVAMPAFPIRRIRS